MTVMVLDGWKQYLLGGDASELVFECRRCGTIVDRSDSYCPECGSVEIARYEIR